jgi:hypothetical protein
MESGLPEDFLMLSGTEQFQSSGLDLVNQEPIAFDMAFLETLPFPLETVFLLSSTQGNVST